MKLSRGQTGVTSVSKPSRVTTHRVVHAKHESLNHNTRLHSWRTFGPNAEHSDGDADFYKITSRLTEQYEWFAPTPQEEPEQQSSLLTNPNEFGLSPKQIAALGLSGPRSSLPDPATLSSKAYMRGDKFTPDQFGYNLVNMARTPMKVGGTYTSGARASASAAPEGRPVFLPEAERYGNPPDLPSLLLSQRIIYISMPFLPSVTELVVAQCYYLDFDDRNRNKPIYVYINSTGCINDKGQAVAPDNEFYAIWAALGFAKAPLYTGVTWRAQNQAAVLLAAGQRGHRYTFPHAKISTAPPITNRVFGPTVDAQLQAAELEYATKYYAAIMSRATGKSMAVCEKEYLSRKRYFSVKDAYEEGIVDKLIPGYELNRMRKLRREKFGDRDTFVPKDKPKFRFNRQQ